MKRLLIGIFVCCLAVFTVISAAADSYSLYGSISQSDSICNNLLGIYRNKEGFNPYDEYLIARTGQYEYYLFYSPSLAGGDYSYIRYYNSGSGYNTYWTYSEGTGTNFSINYGNYLPVGNVDSSISSSVFETFKFQYLIAIVAILLTVLIIFKIFKFSIKGHINNSGGWSYG